MRRLTAFGQDTKSVTEFSQRKPEILCCVQTSSKKNRFGGNHDTHLLKLIVTRPFVLRSLSRIIFCTIREVIICKTMKSQSSIFIRIVFCAVLLTLLLFCNRPTVQRGPEQDTTMNTAPADNTINADTLNQPDSTGAQSDTTRLPG